MKKEAKYFPAQLKFCKKESENFPGSVKFCEKERKIFLDHNRYQSPKRGSEDFGCVATQFTCSTHERVSVFRLMVENFAILPLTVEFIPL